jgi:GntR family transcriptional regulator
MSVRFHIDPADPRPIYQQIMDEIRRALVVGTLEPDAPLPSVRQLAGELRINPNTVQQAYRELEREGLVYVQRGQGTFLSSRALPEEERVRLTAQVAARALRDAWRHGLGAEELISALKKAAAGDGRGLPAASGATLEAAPDDRPGGNEA